MLNPYEDQSQMWLCSRRPSSSSSTVFNLIWSLDPLGVCLQTCISTTAHFYFQQLLNCGVSPVSALISLKHKSSECIAQSSQNFGCTVQFTLLFLPWSMHPSWGCGVHPIALPWATEGERHGLACQTLHTFLPLTLESRFGFTMAWVLWLLNHSLEFSKRYSFLYTVSSVFLLRTEGL